LDSKQVGTLDASGNLRVTNVVSEGRHVVDFAKEGFESQSVSVNVKPPSDALIPSIKLSQSKVSLAFETDAKNVTVRYRREGETEYKETSAGGKVSVSPGTYEIIATASGYSELQFTQAVTREGAVVPLQFAASSGMAMYEDSTQVVQAGEWFKSKNPGNFVPLKTGMLRVALIFANPGKTLLWDKKVEWLLEIPQSHARVRYTLEGHKLTRKVEGEGLGVEPKTAKVDAQSQTRKELISVHVRAEGSTIQVTNDKQAVLDEYDFAGQNLSKAHLAIRTDQAFVVRSDNP